MATYGAPVWADRLRTTARNKAALRSAQRIIVVRVIRGHRTVSWAAATALAGDSPWELVAEGRSANAEVGEGPGGAAVRHTRTDAIRPVLERWMRRKRIPLTFRLTQVLTRHGCFGDYLCRTAQREPTPECHDCGAAVDSAQHTLEVSPRWAALCQSLTSVLGGDLSLPSIITAMLGDDEFWKAMVSFCETVMSQKEPDERRREEAADVASIRGRRMGVRRRRYLMRLQ
ncbi:unnamed protein product [Euphydryas editha]|uniref:Uncharacterized protein n=1 Tax=Euphydryas editha TaxID=104508 RepID=A0AAU9UD76_EUPED|nr:unnamed protein product [Euphydryas editha]